MVVWTDPLPRSGASNMAWDQTLLDLAEAEGRFVVRLYRWEPFCLSLGRNEPALRRYDRARIEALGMDVVRRPTGGRAVWHARELTYAVAAPAERFGSLPEAYRAIHDALAAAVRSLGAPAELASQTAAAPLDTGACFASPAGGEVMVRGRKVVGSAQVRQGGALLQHGAMLLEDDQAAVAAVTAGSPPPDASASLSALLGRRIGFDEAARVVAGAVRSAWPGAWNETSAAEPAGVADPAALMEQVARHERRFRDPAWTWLR